MHTAPTDQSPKTRSALLRWALTLGILTALGSVGALGLDWAREPGRRNPTTIAFDLPLKPGTRVEHEFTAQTDWMFEARIRVEHDPSVAPGPVDEPSRRTDEDPPEGLRIAYEVHADDATDVARGSTSEFQTFANNGKRWTTGYFAVEHGKRIPYRIALETTSAPPEFAELTARIEVGPVGDFISYRSLEGQIRHLLLFVALGLGIALAFAWLVMLWRARAHEPRGPRATQLNEAPIEPRL